MFKRIGDVAARLIADPVKLQAAASEAPRMGGGLTGEDSISPPVIASTAGGQTGGNGKGKRKRPSNGGDRARPVQEGNNVMQSGGTALSSTTYGRHTPPALRLISDKGMRSHAPTRFAPSRLRSPLVLVVNNGVPH